MANSHVRGKIHAWHVILGVVLILLVLAGLNLGMNEVYYRFLRPFPTPVPVPPTAPPPPTPTLTAVPTATPTPRPTTAPPRTTTLAPTSTGPVVLTPTVTPTPLSFDDPRIQEAFQRIYFHEQLLKASLQLLRAETYLDSNDLKQVERELIAVSATLDQAGLFADEALVATVADLQRDLSRLREDLYLRPERLREGIRRLWQRVDVLIGE